MQRLLTAFSGEGGGETRYGDATGKGVQKLCPSYLQENGESPGL